MEDDELENAMREGLRARASGVDVDVSRREVAGATAAARRRRRTTRVLVGLAAASVVAVVVTATLTHDGGERDRVLDPAGPSEPALDRGEWRTEVWGDVAVDVPADWGYGGAPDERGVACFPGASLDAAGERVRDPRKVAGYVGRPIGLTDVCASIDAGAPVASPYVWLGAGLPVGTVELSDGFVQETVEAEGETVTVATQDPEVREQILSSVTASETCLSELTRSGPIIHDQADDPAATPTTLRVCTYRLGDEPGGTGGWELTSAMDLGTPALTDYLEAVGAGEAPRDQCPAIDYQLTEAAVLEVLDESGGVLRQDAVNAFCPGIAVGAETVWALETTRMTSAMTRPWVMGVVRAVMSGDPDLGFIGPQG